MSQSPRVAPPPPRQHPPVARAHDDRLLADALGKRPKRPVRPDAPSPRGPNLPSHPASPSALHHPSWPSPQSSDPVLVRRRAGSAPASDLLGPAALLVTSEEREEGEEEEEEEEESSSESAVSFLGSVEGEKCVAKDGSSVWDWLPVDAWRHQLYIVSVIVFFAGSSLGAIFINKTCLTGYHFRYPLTLMLGQMGFAVGVLSTMHVAGYQRLPRARGRELAVLALPTALFTSNVVIGLSALSLVNIPMFSAFRRLTLLFVMAAEYVFLNKTHSAAIVQAVVVMTVGAFISAVDDVTFSRLGYCLVFINNVLTAAYLASIKRAMKETEYDPLALLYYTALMGFPVVALLLMMTGELGHVMVAFRTQPELSSAGFMASLLLTATGAFAVNYSTSLCTHVTSPLTTSVAGQVKNVLQTVLGFFSWGFIPTTMNTVGLLVALGAQVWFAVLKFREGHQGKARGGDAERPGSACAARARRASVREDGGSGACSL